MATEQLLTARMIMKRLGIARSTLHKWQTTRDFPQPLRLAHNVVRWRLEDVERWIEIYFKPTQSANMRT